MTQMTYRYQPRTGKWDKIPLDVGGVAVSGIDVNDLNGGGAPDIGTSPTNNVVCFSAHPGPRLFRGRHQECETP